MTRRHSQGDKCTPRQGQWKKQKQLKIIALTFTDLISHTENHGFIIFFPFRALICFKVPPHSELSCSLKFHQVKKPSLLLISYLQLVPRVPLYIMISIIRSIICLISSNSLLNRSGECPITVIIATIYWAPHCARSIK